MSKIVFLSTQSLDGYTHDDHILEGELKRRGHEVSTQNWESLKDGGQDLFLIRTTSNYTEHLSSFLETLLSVSDRLWNPLPLIKWNSNKGYLLELAASGVKVMPMQLVENQSELEEAMDHFDCHTFVAKPPVSASAKGLIKFTRENIPEISAQMILQPFYNQILDGEVSLIYFNGKLAYATHKKPKSGDFRVQEEYGGIITAHSPTDEEKEIAEKALANIKPNWLYARVDLVPGIGLIELEMVEPALYFGTNKQSAAFFADAITETCF